MDLFDYMKSRMEEKEAPLAMRMRPRTLDEVIGQEHMIGKGRLLYRAISADKLSSVLFYGPPGTGKTTIAKVIANTTRASFVQLNATTSGNPFVEDGTVILIGATTENPYFEVNPALLSRSTIFELKPLTKEQIAELLERAMKDPDRGLGSYRAELTDDARDFLADVAGGDARTALNALELAVMTTGRGEDGRLRIDLAVAEDCIQKRAVHYDKNGDQHYDTISAFIKSMRGSDPDAAVYYLAKMLEAGEDIRFIARRMMICASEDVGNADPQALTIAVSAAQAVERVGMPESQLILAHAAIYIACAPKSNSVTNAIFAATQSVREKKTTVPVHLQDAHYSGHDDLGHGIGYRYAHDYPKHYVKQQYLPDELAGEHFYEPGELGYEAEIRRHFAFLAEEGQQTQGNAEE